MGERKKDLDRIQEAIRNSQTVSATEVRDWLQEPSLDELALVTEFILEHRSKIDPPLTIEQTCIAVRTYYIRALEGDYESEFVPPFHIAGHELVRWFRRVWNNTAVPRECIHELKTALAELYRSSDQKRAEKIINAVIEHLLETPEIRMYFADWKSDPVLNQAYIRAMEWVEKSPQ
jgi:hypothetical protein